MRILLYSHLFYPSLGGIETISEQMALRFEELGHKCTVVTASALAGHQEPAAPYRVVRNAPFREKVRLAREHDIVYSSGASTELFWPAKLAGKPFVWTHQGYQLTSLDGLGWVEGQAAPLRPLPSLLYHLRRPGRVGYAWNRFARVQARRAVARFGAVNVSVTEWVGKRQPLRGQVTLYTPYKTERFKRIADRQEWDYRFFYVGRLVSEKGVATLLRAFAKVSSQLPSVGKLLVIGDGNWRAKLEQSASDLRIRERVDFVGRKSGDDLLASVAKGKTAVIPSQWEEPMGGVCLEMLAAGRLVIASRNGGLAECAGEAGLLFENGNSDDLAEKMIRIETEPTLEKRLREKQPAQLAKFDETALVKRYVQLFEEVLARR